MTTLIEARQPPAVANLPLPFLQLQALRRVGVFRTGGLGEVLCTQPLLRAVRKACPAASLSWIGPAWAEEVARRWGLTDRFIVFPDFGGRYRPPSAQALRQCLAEVHGARLSLLLQTHASNDPVHAFVGACGAFQTAGFSAAEPASGSPVSAAAGASRLHCPLPRSGHEIDRLLALSRHLGMRDAERDLDLPVLPQDHDALEALWPGVASAASIVCIQPGAPTAARRWPVDRHAAVAAHLMRRGHTVVLVGGGEDRPLAEDMAAMLPRPAVDLVGRTTLWSLAALLSRADLLIAHDTGLSLLAVAIGTPGVTLSMATDAARWAPPSSPLHHLMAQALHCRPCAHDSCPTAHGCATMLGTREVLAAAEGLLGRRIRAGAAAQRGPSTVVMPLMPMLTSMPNDRAR